MRPLVPLALFLGALAVRAIGWREVVGGDHVLPVDADSWYHLRRIAYTLHAFPAVLEFDRYLNHPEGAKPIWTPLFDWCAAFVLRPFVGSLPDGGYGRLERLAMWLPPLLGAATVVLAHRVALRHFGAGAALVAGVSLCLLSGHFWYTQIGFLDHHGALGLGITALLAAQLGWIAREEAGATAAAWRAALACGLAIALCFAIWPGGLLHVALLELAAWAFVLATRDGVRARGRAARRAASFAVAGVALAPLCLGNEWPQWGRLSPVVLSDFQPWLLGCAALVWLACAAGWGPRIGRRDVRALFFALAVLAVGLASLALLPDVRAGAGDAWRWLAKREAFQAQVAESQPLLMDEHGFTVAIALARLSPFGLLYPLAAVWLALRLRRRPERARAWTLLAFGAGLYAATLLQRRFFDTATIPIALALGLAAREGFALLRARTGDARARLALAAALALVLLPTLRGYLRPLINEWNAWRGAKLWVTGGFGFDRAGLETALELRAATPVTAGWLDPTERPAYGVLAPWYLGHVIEYAGRRPTVVNNFGDDLGEESFAFAERYYHAREAEIAFELDRRAVRYVVAQRYPTFLAQPPRPGSLFEALHLLDGSGRRDAESGELGAPALERHRLVFESRGRDFRDDAAAPVYKLFEVVAGATVSGRADAGRAIDVGLYVVTNRGRQFLYDTQVVADGEGRYRVRVPYATAGGPPAIRAASWYRFACGGESKGVMVGEADVQEGRELAGPDLCWSGGAGAALVPGRAQADTEAR